MLGYAREKYYRKKKILKVGKRTFQVRIMSMCSNRPNKNTINP